MVPHWDAVVGLGWAGRRTSWWLGRKKDFLVRECGEEELSYGDGLESVPGTSGDALSGLLLVIPGGGMRKVSFVGRV